MLNKFKFIRYILLAILITSCHSKKEIICFGDKDGDLPQLLIKEGYKLTFYPTVTEALNNASENTGVLLLSEYYPQIGVTLTLEDNAIIDKKNLRVFVEFPEQIEETKKRQCDTLDLERIVVCDSLSPLLPKMCLLSFNRCVSNHLDDSISSPLLVAAKVAGFNDAVYGIENTPIKNILYYRNKSLLVSTTRLSNFASYRYMPEQKIKSLFEYIFKWLLQENFDGFSSWTSYITPSYSSSDILPKDARYSSIKKGIEWFYNGRFIVNEKWKSKWVDKYMGDGTMPIGPGLPDSLENGDGSWGVLEGHMSGIYYDGRQSYRYWMRDDVQGESSYAFAVAGKVLNNTDYSIVSGNLIDYSLREYRDSVRNMPSSPSYGLLGWAYTHKNTYYGDDNARSLLGSIAAAAILNKGKWDKLLLEGIVGNFRTTGIHGFRSGVLQDPDLQKRGWRSYYESDIVNLHAHFESWNWACYLWLYNQTQYAPLLERAKKGICKMMQGYPEQWQWTNGIQQERARMILPLAWLYRVEPTQEHSDWLDYMVKELLKNQVDCGGIREELGDESKGSFGQTPSNEAYGKNEAPLIFKNGDPVADMLYTTNFAFVGLCEAAQATKKVEYQEALNKMNDFLIRIQVKSQRFKDVDGAWFRAFNYEDWNYWASNADAGWGAWSTLTGWIQSWIVGTQAIMEMDTSLWDIMNSRDLSDTAQIVIDEMITNNKFH